MSHKHNLVKLLLTSFTQDHLALKSGEKLVLSIIPPDSKDRGQCESGRIIASYTNTTKEALSTSRQELLRELLGDQPESRQLLSAGNLLDTSSATSASGPLQARSTRKGVEERESLRGDHSSTTDQPKSHLATPAVRSQPVRSTRKGAEERESLCDNQSSRTSQPKTPSAAPAVESPQPRPTRKGIEERESLSSSQSSTTNLPKTASATLVASKQPRVQLARKGSKEGDDLSGKQSPTTHQTKIASTAPMATASSRAQSARRAQQESHPQPRDEVPDIIETRRINKANGPSSSSSTAITVPSTSKSNNAVSLGKKRKREDPETQDGSPAMNATSKLAKLGPADTIAAYTKQISKFQISRGVQILSVFRYRRRPANPGSVDYETAREIFGAILELLMLKDKFASDGVPLPGPAVEVTAKTLEGWTEDMQTMAQKFDESCRTFLSMDRQRRGMTLQEKLFMLELHRLGARLDRCRETGERLAKRRTITEAPTTVNGTSHPLSSRVVDHYQTKHDKDSIDIARRKGEKLELFLEKAGPSAIFLLCLHSSTDKFMRNTNYQASAILMAMMQQKRQLLEILLDVNKPGWRQVLVRYVTDMDLKPGIELNEKYPDNVVLQAKGTLKDGLQYSAVQIWATEDSPRSYTDHVIFSSNLEDYESMKDMTKTHKLVEAMRADCGEIADTNCVPAKNCICPQCEKESLIPLVLVKEDSPILGIGAYCGQKRKKGQLVTEFGGILSSVSRNRMDDIEISPGLILQVDRYANECIYINHAPAGDLTSAYTANVQMEVKLYGQGGKLLPRVLVYAKRDIDILERVLLDYGQNYRTDTLEDWSIPLHCRNDAF